MTTKIDHKHELKPYYSVTQKQPHILEIPAMNYLMIDGQGDPNTATAYADAVSTLYALSYAIRFAVKDAINIAYSVMPLEGLWYADDFSVYTANARAAWQWTSMILQPELVTQDLVTAQVEIVRAKKQPPAIDKVRFEVYDEGLVVQRLYFGPYRDEGPFIQEMHAYAEDQGYHLRGKHHEIYLNDPRKVAPEKLKTILRQQITRN
jgi:hypothetical protein